MPKIPFEVEFAKAARRRWEAVEREQAFLLSCAQAVAERGRALELADMLRGRAIQAEVEDPASIQISIHIVATVSATIHFGPSWLPMKAGRALLGLRRRLLGDERAREAFLVKAFERIAEIDAKLGAASGASAPGGLAQAWEREDIAQASADPGREAKASRL